MRAPFLGIQRLGFTLDRVPDRVVKPKVEPCAEAAIELSNDDDDEQPRTLDLGGHMLIRRPIHLKIQDNPR